MSFLNIVFPHIDPIIVSIGPMDIRWYAIAYVAGILLGWWYISHLNRNSGALTPRPYDDLVLWIVVGVLFGGRIGYVLFYNIEYYAAHPFEIVAIWQGGMSFHGGLLGVLLSIYIMCRNYGLKWLAVMDLFAAATPIGLFFGRIANFINAELVGRVTEVPWGVVFPGDPFPRHPSQLYEAAGEGVILFIILWFAAFHTNALKRVGMLSGIFLAGYGSIRFAVEYFREPDFQLGLIISELTMGQLLSIPMVLIGIWLIFRKPSETSPAPETK